MRSTLKLLKTEREVRAFHEMRSPALSTSRGALTATFFVERLCPLGIPIVKNALRSKLWLCDLCLSAL
jgi:hypothetical protein